MTGDSGTDADLPEHVDQTVRLIAKLHSDHREAATPIQRAVEGVVVGLGNPRSLVVLGCIALSWIAVNLTLGAIGLQQFDVPPFPYLALIATLASLGMTILIVMTQRRDDQLAHHREQLTLQLAMVSEQKLAKVIALLEESRRDNPLLSNRVDHSANAMSEPTDPESLGAAIKRNEEQS